MATSTQDAQSKFEMSLRDQLMAAQQQPEPETPSQATSGPSPYPTESRSPQGSDSRIDPSIGGGGPSPGQHQGDYGMGPMVMDDPMGDMSGGKGGARRELSTTKRAAQNRAAQRAFRQRKEAYITKLEKQVKDYRAMEDDFKALQHENYQLREYILSLQTRILESSSDLPPPPPRVNLQEPLAPSHVQDPQLADDSQRPPEEQSRAAPTASMTAERSANEDGISRAAVEQLQAAAAEAGELGSAPKTES